MKQLFILTIAAILAFMIPETSAQTLLKPEHYLVSLKDKADSPYSVKKPEKFLSKRAIQNKHSHKVEITEEDLPVNPAYLDQIRSTGADVLFTSRWFNSAVIKATPEILENVMTLDCVVAEQHYPDGSCIQKLDPTQKAKERHPLSIVKDSISKDEVIYGLTAIRWLHEQGFDGKGMLVGVIDAGFQNADRISPMSNLMNEKRVSFTKDFVERGGDVYRADAHGLAVLSVIAGTTRDDENYMEGTCPKADFALLRSEDGTTRSNGKDEESWFEEEAWIAAIECADSLGVEVVNSSLGYTTFADEFQNHTTCDIYGNQLRVQRAANKAVDKNIAVVFSAGNDGANNWHFIGVPADSENVLTVGAVDEYGVPATFTSYGVSEYRYVKPDVSALGVRVPVIRPDGNYGQGNGTSFASPLVAGGVACLRQMFPTRTAVEILDAVRKSASSFDSPSNLTGYGLPDFKKAYEILSALD